MGESGRDLHRGPPAEKRGREWGDAGLGRDTRQKRNDDGARSPGVRIPSNATVPLALRALSLASGPAHSQPRAVNPAFFRPRFPQRRAAAID